MRERVEDYKAFILRLDGAGEMSLADDLRTTRG